MTNSSGRDTRYNFSNYTQLNLNKRIKRYFMFEPAAEIFFRFSQFMFETQKDIKVCRVIDTVCILRLEQERH